MLSFWGGGRQDAGSWTPSPFRSLLGAPKDTNTIYKNKSNGEKNNTYLGTWHFWLNKGLKYKITSLKILITKAVIRFFKYNFVQLLTITVNRWLKSKSCSLVPAYP